MITTIQLESLQQQARELLAESAQQPLPALPVKVYLAGPSVFYPDVASLSAQLKADCRKLGMEPNATKLSLFSMFFTTTCNLFHFMSGACQK